MYVTGKKGYYLILSGHKYRTSISKEFSELLMYDIVVSNIGRLEVDTGSTGRNPLYLGMSYQDGINSMTDLSYLKDLKNYTNNQHNEFIIIEDKFSLEGFGGGSWLANDIEQEIIYDGGLNFSTVDYRNHFNLTNPSSTSWSYMNVYSTYPNRAYIKSTIKSCTFNNTNSPITATTISNNLRANAATMYYGRIYSKIEFTLTDAVWGPLGISVLTRIEKLIA